MKRYLILPDLHVPNHDTKALSAVLKYAKKYQWAGVVQLGDFLDVESISAHNRGKPKLVEGKRLQDEYRAGRRVLDMIQRATDFAKFHYIQGNHEHRIDRFLEEHPQLEGIVDVPLGLGLKERRIDFIRSWEDMTKILRIGHAHFHHGHSLSRNHTAAMLRLFGTNIFYGHVHDMQQASAKILGKDKHIIAQSCGHLADPKKLTYTRQAPNNWQSGFIEMHVLPNGYFHHYCVRIFNGEFVGPDGKHYKGRK